MDKPETYKCNYGDGCKLVVRQGVSGRFVFIAIDKNGKEVIVIPAAEDTLRLIAQLTAALPSELLGESEQLPDEETCRQSLEDFQNGNSQDIKEIIAELEDEDTMEVRIAVVTARSGMYDEKCTKKPPSFHAYGHSDDTDEQASHGMTADADDEEALVPSPRLLSWVTARVPLPPKPVVHEVEGEVEVQK